MSRIVRWVLAPNRRAWFVTGAVAAILGLGFVSEFTTVNNVRGDFCEWAKVHVSALMQEGHLTHGQHADLVADRQLRDRMCGLSAC